MKRDLPAVEEELERLKSLQEIILTFQKMLYTYNKALLYSLQYKYTQALEYLLKTEVMAKEGIMKQEYIIIWH